MLVIDLGRLCKLYTYFDRYNVGSLKHSSCVGERIQA